MYLLAIAFGAHASHCRAAKTQIICSLIAIIAANTLRLDGVGGAHAEGVAEEAHRLHIARQVAVVLSIWVARHPPRNAVLLDRLMNKTDGVAVAEARVGNAHGRGLQKRHLHPLVQEKGRLVRSGAKDCCCCLFGIGGGRPDLHLRYFAGAHRPRQVLDEAETRSEIVFGGFFTDGIVGFSPQTILEISLQMYNKWS